jgi:hypothetical protein
MAFKQQKRRATRCGLSQRFLNFRDYFHFNPHHARVVTRQRRQPLPGGRLLFFLVKLLTKLILAGQRNGFISVTVRPTQKATAKQKPGAALNSLPLKAIKQVGNFEHFILFNIHNHAYGLFQQFVKLIVFFLGRVCCRHGDPLIIIYFK